MKKINIKFLKESLNIQELKKDIKNPRAILPNLLSASRIAAPFVIPPLIFSGNIPLVIGATSAFLLTDFLDGKIARALNGQTKLGSLLDQVADKICSIGLLLALIPSTPIMAIPLILEGTISAINIKTTAKNKKAGKSLQSGRIKMWPLSASLIFGYASLLSPSTILTILTYLSIISTATLEIVNIKEYHNISKTNPESKKENPVQLETKTKTKNKKAKTQSNNLHKTYTEEELKAYIDKCESIDSLTAIKEAIEPTALISASKKPIQKKR